MAGKTRVVTHHIYWEWLDKELTPQRHRAICDCGWTGERFDWDDRKAWKAADLAAREHRATHAKKVSRG